jgi:hypothetical protein
MLRVLLGIATAGSPTKAFLASLTALRLPREVETLERSIAMGNFTPAQRELIAQDAVEGNYDYLLFIDDDVVFPPNTLTLLIETMESDPNTAVVGGLYYSRDSIKPMAVIDWDGGDTTSAAIPAFSSDSTDPVDGIGFGCALLRVSALRALSQPYFPVHVFIDRRSRSVRLCDEDYRYCERIRHAGHTIRLDARVRCSHFDRDTDTVAPVIWEADDVTNQRRMFVVENGRQRLVPFDGRVARAPEAHMAADVVYMTVD